MKYVIGFVFIAALLPGVGPDLNMGVFYLSPLRFLFLLLPVVYFGKNLLLKKENRYYINRSNLMSIVFFAVWFLYSLLSVFWVRNIDYWIHGEYFIGIGLFCILFFDMADLQTEDFVFILKGVAAVIVFHNILGWYEIITHNYLFATRERIAIMAEHRDYYPVTTMLNQNDLVSVLIFGVCISFYFMTMYRNRWIKTASGVLLISNIGLAFETDSRAGLVGVGICLLTVCLLSFSKEQKLRIAFLVVLSVSVFIFLKPGIVFDIADRVKEIELIDFENPLVNSDAVRLNLIRNGLVFLKATFGAGVGTGNAECWMETAPVYNVRGFTNMHNWWAEILTNFGIVIFILYILFYCSLFQSLLKRYRSTKDKECKSICVIFTGFMAAFSVASISSSSNWGKEWLWVLWALMIAFQGKSEETVSD